MDKIYELSTYALGLSLVFLPVFRAIIFQGQGSEAIQSGPDYLCTLTLGLGFLGIGRAFHRKSST